MSRHILFGRIGIILRKFTWHCSSQTVQNLSIAMGISRIASEAPFGADLDRFGVIFMDFRSRHNRWELMSLIHEEFKEMDII